MSNFYLFKKRVLAFVVAVVVDYVIYLNFLNFGSSNYYTMKEED